MGPSEVQWPARSSPLRLVETWPIRNRRGFSARWMKLFVVHFVEPSGIVVCFTEDERNRHAKNAHRRHSRRRRLIGFPLADHGDGADQTTGAGGKAHRRS